MLDSFGSLDMYVSTGSSSGGILMRCMNQQLWVSSPVCPDQNPTYMCKSFIPQSTKDCGLECKVVSSKQRHLHSGSAPSSLPSLYMEAASLCLLTFSSILSKNKTLGNLKFFTWTHNSQGQGISLFFIDNIFLNK